MRWQNPRGNQALGGVAERLRVALADLDPLLDDLLAGRRSASPDDPPWVGRLLAHLAERAAQERRLAVYRDVLERITRCLMRLASLDFGEMPTPTFTGDDLADAAWLGLVMMAEELHDAQQGLQLARDQAVQANRVKSSFLANMSHELRTPLNVVIGYTELAREELRTAPDAADADLGRVERAARHLLGLISDILDLSKIEAGRLEVSAEPVDPMPILVEVCESVRRQAESNGNVVVLHATVVPDLRSDPIRVRQVLFNLVGNAAKYTRNGRIEIAAGVGSEGRVWIEVRDNGPGISAENVARLFQPFYRVDERSHEPGTGLGLAISARLCERMGGRIEVETELRRGSTFRLWLPCWSEAPEEVPCP